MKRVLSSLKRQVKSLDFFLLMPVLLASLYSLVLVLSATSTASRFYSRNFQVQVAAVLLGIVAMLIIASIDLDMLTSLWQLLYISTVLIVVVTILFGKGPTGTSNRNWLRLGPVNIQPSEFAKLSFILITAQTLDRIKESINQFASLIYLILVSGSLLGLMALQKDTGTLLVYVFIFIVMVFCAGLDWRFFAAGGAVLTLLLPIAWNVMPDYMQKRILFGFKPELDPQKWGFQALQSKIAIGSGQMYGKGLFKGTQINLIPEHQTDFIFATAGEEFGFIGSVAVLVLLLCIIYRVLVHANRASTDTGTLVCTGVFAMLVAQAMINIGMCLAIFPVIGITLPFFSYGGSSMLACWCAVGLVLSVNRQREMTLSFQNE